MRRISARYAQQGMVLARQVLESSGDILLRKGIELRGADLALLADAGVRELMIEDRRVPDVPVLPLIAPEQELEASRSLRLLMTKNRGRRQLDAGLLEQAVKPVYDMTRDLSRDAIREIGEVNAAGCFSQDDFCFVRPVKTAVLSLLMGKLTGWDLLAMPTLGASALLADIGFMQLPPSSLAKHERLAEKEPQEIQEHALLGAGLLDHSGMFGPEVSQAVMQHHERWDGGGYPGGLKGEDISLSARILTIADTYYELVSERPNRRAYMPHEAIEFIMAYSGDIFDPRLVQVFARQVPMYPTGVSVVLNTGEAGIISGSNPGLIGRPVVRVCIDANRRPVSEPYDLDLSTHQDRLIAQVLEY